MDILYALTEFRSWLKFLQYVYHPQPLSVLWSRFLNYKFYIEICDFFNDPCLINLQILDSGLKFYAIPSPALPLVTEGTVMDLIFLLILISRKHCMFTVCGCIQLILRTLLDGGSQFYKV